MRHLIFAILLGSMLCTGSIRSFAADGHWIQDEEDRWYYMNQNGSMNTKERREIDGETFYFHEDGSLVANEFLKFQYVDENGRKAPECNVTAVDEKGHRLTIEDSVKEEIADRLNELPGGWLRHFMEEGYRFVYHPEKDHYAFGTSEDRSERFYIRYRIRNHEKTISFCDPDAISMAFGEYIYRRSIPLLRSQYFIEDARACSDEIHEMTGLTDYFDEDSDTVFAAVFAAYVEDPERSEFTDDLYFLADDLREVINSMP